MKIEYMKFLEGYAEGYELTIYDDTDIELKCPDEVVITNVDYLTMEEEPVYYSDLLQKAIEGINQKFGEFTIGYVPGGFKVFRETEMVRYYRIVNRTTDQAKNAALEYVYKREMKT